MWGRENQLHFPLPVVSLTWSSSHSDLCDLSLLKPLWQLFTHMEYSLYEDVTQPGVLLPLHRALTELFFVTENRAQVRALPASCLGPLGQGTAPPSALASSAAQDSGHSPIPSPGGCVVEVLAVLHRKADEAYGLRPSPSSPSSTWTTYFIRPKAKGETALDQSLTIGSFGK